MGKAEEWCWGAHAKGLVRVWADLRAREAIVHAAHLHAPRELTYEIDEIYICEDNSNALALPPTLRRRCHWHSRRRDGAEPLHTAFYHDALQLRG